MGPVNSPEVPPGDALFSSDEVLQSPLKKALSGNRRGLYPWTFQESSLQRRLPFCSLGRLVAPFLLLTLGQLEVRRSFFFFGWRGCSFGTTVVAPLSVFFPPPK